MIKFLFLILTFLLFTHQLAFTQQYCDGKTNILSTKSKKAEKYYMLGLEYMRMRDNTLCISSMLEAIKADNNFVEAYIVLGDMYIGTEQYEFAEFNLKKAIQLDSQKYPSAYLSMGDVYFSTNRYALAKENYAMYLSFPSVYEQSKPRIKKLIANCEFAIEAMNNPVPFNPINLGDAINSPEDEYFPTTTVDDATLLFTRAVIDRSNPYGTQEDFYVSTKLNDKWSPAVNVGTPINTVFNEGAPTLSPDGQTLILTACQINGTYGPGRDGFGSCDLFFTRKNGSSWLSPQNLSVPINTRNWETQPSLSSDGRTMYFVRGIGRGPEKEQDIWMTKVGSDGIWETPVKLPTIINTPDIEESVFIHPDGQTLYFSSAGHPGMGGLDIYMSRKDSAGNWTTPVNLGYPINTSQNENSLLISGDGKTAYFASNREGGFGKLDIYSFELPEAVRPVPTSFMKGKVYDADTKNPLFAQFDLIDLQTGAVVVSSYSNKGNGEFLVSLPANKNYALNVSKKGYLFYSENFELTTANSNTAPVNRDVPLKPIKAGETIVLKNVFFDSDKFNLKVESSIELNRLIELLTKNPNMRIEIGGHTDDRSDDKYNLTLSENRAKSVLDYMVENGVAASRLTYKGYGETVPLTTNETEEGRALNRRTEFKVLNVN